MKGNDILPHIKSSPLCSLRELQGFKGTQRSCNSTSHFTDEETEKNISIIPFQKLMRLELNYLNKLNYVKLN